MRVYFHIYRPIVKCYGKKLWLAGRVNLSLFPKKELDIVKLLPSTVADEI